MNNKNVELRGKNSFKLFTNGISHYIRNGISVDGGFHIAMARHMHVYLCNVEYLPLTMKHNNLLLPVKKVNLGEYQNTIDSLLVMLKSICRDSSASDCNSFKFHAPHHWGDTRWELGCAADEKTLEKKLSESQKRHYSFTNGKSNIDAQMVLCHVN